MREFEVEISYSWGWEFIASTRAYFEHLFRESFGSDAVAGRVTIATHELLENAFKYGLAERRGAVRFRLHLEGDRVIVDVTNRATPDNIAVLRERVEEAKRGSPME